MPLRWADDEDIAGDAVRLAIELDHPAYDCMYLAPAHRLGARLVTADAYFARLVAPTVHGGAVVTLSSYADASRAPGRLRLTGAGPPTPQRDP